ncbi:MAG TPA: NAD(+)/NADH kinase [Solirubrobacteraceae bacterium]|nr:NAD(+)/NADH kinase [Solirubrobacteraceae bacterium]
MSCIAAAAVLTHNRPHETRALLEQLIAAAREYGVVLHFDADETAKLGLSGDDTVVVDAPRRAPVDLCIVFGGDGTILKGLRRYCGTAVPVFAVNFGEVGFLAALEPEEVDEFGFGRVFSCDFDVLHLPAIAMETGGNGPSKAFNDVSVHRKIGARVAQLAYGVEGEEVGSVRCDGLVICTPAGSTGYNLANGGPVLAWGVEGFGVSFIAPHSLTARALVVAPGDTLRVTNHGGDAVDVSIDGRPACEIAPGEVLRARFEPGAGRLAQLPGASFYRRLRAKFGRLSS